MDQVWFDEWADEYDRDVLESDREGSFPFAGYSRLLDEIARTVLAKPGAEVLDLGFGTALLTRTFSEAGMKVTGIDFSQKMCQIAAARMPGARLICEDFSRGLPQALDGETFDFIVSTYAFHHVPESQKATRLRELVKALKPGGMVLIGDISFASNADKQRCEREFGELWDDQESYMVYEDHLPQIADLEPVFKTISICAGIQTICV